MANREQIEKLVREKLSTHLTGNSSSPALDFVGAEHLNSLAPSVKCIFITPGAIVTPLAKDIASKKGIELKVSGGSQKSHSPSSPNAVAIGSDHGGYEMKEALKKELQGQYEFVDVGTHSTDAVDYPDIAHAVASLVSSGEVNRGIIIDGAGIGSAIVANKVPGVRAAHCHNLFEVKNSREHNNANVLSLGGRVIGIGLASAMVSLWLETAFEGGRHQRRVDKMMSVEQHYLKRS